ncbi:FAD-dependent oxidoreductase [Paenibacillus guangzhouensis]|uniref:FAD-dependent oxidoreductase n=1 Tax=Paenibacillus guangzhouensis TaxID=1473112 RepID=UPI001266BEDB|nr:FAD-dependent oxidoreductase [Paenibacillus guangzhouensis]
MNSTDAFPQYPDSYWIASSERMAFPALQEDIQADVAVVGGGISGITTALLLAREGLHVVLLEAGELLKGTTGHTTAKVTAQHDLIYHELIQHVGLEKAQYYYRANQEAIQFIKELVHQESIDCGLTDQDAYIYTNDEQYLRKLELEMQAYEQLGIHGELVHSMPLSLSMKQALVMRNQAQFHPLHYLYALVRLFMKLGGKIYEHTTVMTVENGDQPKLVTRDGHHVTCRHTVSCSHFPFYDGMGFYFSRMHAERSYVLGVKCSDPYPGGMYIRAENPTRSIRSTAMADGQTLVLVGGEGHKAGQGVCTIRHYEALQHFAKEQFKVEDIPYRWSTQDLVTLDKVPYIGQISSSVQNVFVATGYRKWGMTQGTLAALLLRDTILERDNPYQALYTPSRFHADPDIKTFVTQNADVAKHLIAGKLEMVRKKPEELKAGEGDVVTVDGQRAGAYRDEQGILHLVDTTCTHMGCEVEWNAGDLSWDCPCHGSRFSIDGEVMEGPAKRPLTRL